MDPILFKIDTVRQINLDSYKWQLQLLQKLKERKFDCEREKGYIAAVKMNLFMLRRMRQAIKNELEWERAKK